MTHVILSDLVASISEFKKHPMNLVKDAQGEMIAILNRNQPVFYCVSPKMMEEFIDVMEDARLAKIVSSRSNEHPIKVEFNDL
jgi:antitoxin StbD